MSFVPTYVCIIITSVFNLHSLLSFIYMVVAVHLGWKKVSVYWSMSLVKFFLGSKENLITIVALCSLGCYVSLRFQMCWGMENWLDHLCLMEHIWSLISVSLRSFWCHRVNLFHYHLMLYWHLTNQFPEHPQIQFFSSFTLSEVSLPLILNKWILPATLHNFYRYVWVGVRYGKQYLGVVRKQTSVEKAWFSYFVSN